MGLRIGDTAPDFEADSTQGRLRFHDWIGDCWAVLFSHPKDFTPVCTTELGYMARSNPSSTAGTSRSSGCRPTRSPTTPGGQPTSRKRRATRRTTR